MLPNRHKRAARESTFSASRMFDELEAGPTALVIGIVKQSDKSGMFLFSPAFNCERWMTIDERNVVRYDPVDVMRCGDHTHHVVQLHLKKPSTEDGELFLAAHALTATRMIRNVSDCYYDPKYRQYISKSTGRPCTPDL